MRSIHIHMMPLHPAAPRNVLVFAEHAGEAFDTVQHYYRRNPPCVHGCKQGWLRNNEVCECSIIFIERSKP